MRRTGVVVLFLSICCGAAAGQTAVPANDSLTIDEAISRVLATHPAVSQAAAGIDAAKARVGQAESGYYPDLAGELLYTRIGPVPTLSFP